MSALSLITDTLSRGGDHLGDLTWWSLADARVDRQELTAIWTGAALPAELLPEPPSAEKAFKGAVREAQVGQGDRLLRLAKDGGDGGDEIVFGVIREARLGNGDLEYTQEARVALDRRRDVIASDRPSHEVVTDIARRYRELRDTHVPDDVRRMVVRALGSFAAVTLRPHGGVYWTPAPFAPQVRRLQEAIQRIGNSIVCIVPVHRTAEAEHTLGAGGARVASHRLDLGEARDCVWSQCVQSV